MSILNELKENVKGNNHLDRKELVKTMKFLSKEGYGDMEIRATEISDKDLEYFQNEGFHVEKYNEEYEYYRIIWEDSLVPKYNPWTSFPFYTVFKLLQFF